MLVREALRRHTFTGDFDAVPKLAGLAIYLDAVVEKLLEVCTIKDAVGSWLGVVDNKLVLDSGSFGSSGLGLEKKSDPV